ncbi:hypothetical protein MJM99_32655, partial [Salmonella enterica subsp. enterica serovar Kentucky]|nr:hypothetical protein [Salmonella enterica subsp. enterica serovar Kentucky]
MDLITLKLDDLLIAHKDLVLLTSVDVRRFIKKMIEGRFPDLDNQAQRDRIIRDNPVEQVKSIKAERTQRTYLTLDEVKALTKAE